MVDSNSIISIIILTINVLKTQEINFQTYLKSKTKVHGIFKQHILNLKTVTCWSQRIKKVYHIIIKYKKDVAILAKQTLKREQLPEIKKFNL